MDDDHQTLEDAKAFVDDLGQLGQAVGGWGCVETIFIEELYVSRLKRTTKVGASPEGAEMMAYLAPPSKRADAYGHGGGGGGLYKQLSTRGGGICQYLSEG